ncbi:MAG: hypothetical protein CMO81_02170 [Waddliaceae bacterium]|nr:hypothetical protein [Waddliaceae bacterium]
MTANVPYSRVSENSTLSTFSSLFLENETSPQKAQLYEIAQFWLRATISPFEDKKQIPLFSSVIDKARDGFTAVPLDHGPLYVPSNELKRCIQVARIAFTGEKNLQQLIHSVATHNQSILLKTWQEASNSNDLNLISLSSKIFNQKEAILQQKGPGLRIFPSFSEKKCRIYRLGEEVFLDIGETPNKGKYKVARRLINPITKTTVQRLSSVLSNQPSLFTNRNGEQRSSSSIERVLQEIQMESNASHAFKQLFGERAHIPFTETIDAYPYMGRVHSKNTNGELICSNTEKFCSFSKDCDRGNLFNLLKQLYREQKTLSLQERLTLTRDLLEAMYTLERAQILHKDIKLENIYLTSNTDGSLRLKIGDFGFARPLEQELRSRKDSGTIQWISPSYISLEVHLGKTTWNSAEEKQKYYAENFEHNDLWASGLILSCFISDHFITFPSWLKKSNVTEIVQSIQGLNTEKIHNLIITRVLVLPNCKLPSEAEQSTRYDQWAMNPIALITAMLLIGKAKAAEALEVFNTYESLSNDEERLNFGREVLKKLFPAYRP